MKQYKTKKVSSKTKKKLGNLTNSNTLEYIRNRESGYPKAQVEHLC